MSIDFISMETSIPDTHCPYCKVGLSIEEGDPYASTRRYTVCPGCGKEIEVIVQYDRVCHTEKIISNG